MDNAEKIRAVSGLIVLLHCAIETAGKSAACGLGKQGIEVLESICDSVQRQLAQLCGKQPEIFEKKLLESARDLLVSEIDGSVCVDASIQAWHFSGGDESTEIKFAVHCPDSGVVTRGENLDNCVREAITAYIEKQRPTGNQPLVLESAAGA